MKISWTLRPGQPSGSSSPGKSGVAEGQGSVRRDELNLLTQSLIPGQRGQGSERRKLLIPGEEPGVLARQPVEVPAAPGHLAVDGTVGVPFGRHM